MLPVSSLCASLLREAQLCEIASTAAQGFKCPCIFPAVLHMHHRDDAQQAREQMDHHLSPASSASNAVQQALPQETIYIPQIRLHHICSVSSRQTATFPA